MTAAMPCADCGLDTLFEYYMVQDALWEAAGLSRGFLCVGCMESRLGRRLVAADFTDAPCNRMTLGETERLRSRRRPHRARRPAPGQLVLFAASPREEEP